MKLFTPEISWHQKEPIFSVDFCPQTWKLATCGADFTIKVSCKSAVSFYFQNIS